MAIYHLSVSTRAKGYGAAHAAYIERAGKYAGREDLEAAESGNMPAWAQTDATRFWDAADQFERANGRAYTEIEISLPRELSVEQRTELVREFVRDTLGERHAYTWAIHNPAASDGQEQPHVHLMFTERVNDGIARDPEQYFKRWNAKNPELGGAGKDRSMSERAFVSQVREQWANTANRYLEREGVSARIDHRSYRDIALAESSRLAELEPQHKRGASVHLQARGVMSDLAGEVREQMARNGERLIAEPRIALDALSAHQSVFTRRDIERFVMGHTDGADQFQAAMTGILATPELLALRSPEGKASHVERYTTQAVLDIETRLLQRVGRLAGQQSDRVVPQDMAQSAQSSRTFNDDQARAFTQLVGTERIATVHGAAGTGKSYVLAGMREAYEAAGFTVHGAILQGKTAEDLERDSGIRSQTIHGFLNAVDKGYTSLSDRSVIVVDEAGMVGSRQMEQLLEHVEASGARLRLVGDTRQLHAVAFGDAFGQLAQRTSVTSLDAIQRQRVDWQRQASEHFSRHEIGAGLGLYEARGHVRGFDDDLSAREALLAQWAADRQAHPDQTQVILAHSNASREALNHLVRQARKADGELGSDTRIQTQKGVLQVAEGERVLFGKNDYGTLQVRNGTLGTVRSVTGEALQVELDSGRQVTVDTREYRHLDYGYALTVHKGQGMTVDRAYLLATPSMSAETTYVGMTRHRQAVTLFYGKDGFADRGGLAAGLSRPEHKTFAGGQEQDALKPLAEQGASAATAPRTLAARMAKTAATKMPESAVPGRARTLGQHLGAQGGGRQATLAGAEPSGGKLSRQQRQAASDEKLRVALAGKPMALQIEVYRQGVERLGAGRQERLARVAEKVEVRRQRRVRSVEALGADRPTPPKGLLSALKQGGYQRDVAAWQSQFTAAQRLAGQAARTQRAVSDAASTHQVNRWAHQLLRERLPDVAQRVQAFQTEQVREQELERQRERERSRGLGRSKDRGLER